MTVQQESSISVLPIAAPITAASSTALGIDIGGTGAKLASIEDGAAGWTTKRSYRKPTSQDLVHAIRDGVAHRNRAFRCVGLCVPGLLDDQKKRVLYSVNVPALMEIELSDLLSQALGNDLASVSVVNDSLATGYDVYSARRPVGRLLVLSLGTGVGAAVLDDGKFLGVDYDSPGHVGQMDVSAPGEEVIGPDGGAGSLEGYIGAPALRQRYGPDPAAKIKPNDPPMLALARAIRICHAIYRPHHIVLAGGVGIRMGKLLPALRGHVERNLTRVARRNWTLGVGNSDFHAASGAARLADLACTQSAGD